MTSPHFMRLGWIIFVILYIPAHSQQFVSGIVIDSSKKPIPFAHILIHESNRGTVTNGNGEFQLYLNTTDRELLITSIGYKSNRVLLEGSKTRYVIELTEDLVLLNEVVITAKDYAQELVKSAIKKIPKNYPQNSELISGFLRERFSKDSLGKEYYHIVESQLEVLKESYQNQHKNGQVRLRQSVNVTESEVTNEMKIYAGGHLAHRFDFVMKRDGFLDSTRMKKYQYEIEDTLRYDGHEVIKIHYERNDSSEFGNIFIDLAKLAFIKVEQFQNTKEVSNRFDSNKRIYLKVITEYFQSNGFWRIGYVNYETKFMNKTSFYLNSVFSTHDFSPIDGEIPYHERLHFSQYMLEATKANNTVDWNGVNRTVSETGVKQAVNANEKKAFDFGRVEYGLELYHSPYRLNEHTISLQNSSINYNASITKDEGVSQGVKISMVYRMNKRWRLHLSTLGNFFGGRLRNSGIEVSYRQPLGIRSRISLEPGLGLQTVQYTTALGTTSLQETFVVKRVELNSNQIKLFSGTSSNNFTSRLNLRYELAYRWSLSLGITHFSRLNFNNGILLMEDENALNNQRIFLKNGRRGLTISPASEVMPLSYYITTGFMYRL